MTPVLRVLLPALGLLLLGSGCQSPSSPPPDADEAPPTDSVYRSYATVPLDADLSDLTDDQAEKVSLFIEAAQAMDGIFWEQAYGNRDSLLQTIEDAEKRRYAALNYGPWDRLHDHEPFIEGVGPKPPGANFYPSDLTAEALRRAAASEDTLTSPHTMVRRLPDGSLTALPYHLFFAESVTTVAGRLQEAAQYTDADDVREGLERRAEGLLNGEYGSGRRAGTPEVDVVIGPMNTDEDRLLGVKASTGALVLRRAPTWSRRLERAATFLSEAPPLPVPDSLRRDLPEEDAHVTAYDALYVAGGANAGPKQSAITDPFGEGPSRFLLPNVMQARTEALLRPMAEELLAENQRSHLRTDARFDHAALRTWGRPVGLDFSGASDSTAVVLQRGMADALAVLLAARLADADDSDLTPMDHYVTELLRWVHALRVDAASPRGRAALLLVNYLREAEALRHDEEAGTLAVNPDATPEALSALVRDLLPLRGDAAEAFVDRYKAMPAFLRSSLDRLEKTDHPKALAFEQGPSVLRGLTPVTAAR